MDNSAGWPFQLSISVIFRDLDAMGHVNNAVYFTYMETARSTFFLKHLHLSDPRELPVIVAEASCTYHSPLQLGELLRVQMGVAQIRRRSFDLNYLMTAGSERLVARAKTALVTYDYQSNQAIPIPPSLKSILEANLSPHSDRG